MDNTGNVLVFLENGKGVIKITKVYFIVFDLLPVIFSMPQKYVGWNGSCYLLK